MRLQLFSSNLLENLAEMLAENIRLPLSSPFDEEIIVVQSGGMARWVSMELARYHGVSANCRFIFPNAFIDEIFRTVMPEISEHSLFDPEIMTWRIMKILPLCIKKPGFEMLRSYLADGAENLKRFQLSQRIADTFDQYLLFRPEMIFRWEQGEDNHWQAVLWRELVKDSVSDHRAARGKAFLETPAEPTGNNKGFPQRVSVFGISALPRFHMEVIASLSRYAAVSLFLMNPCREYWGDILSEWEIKKTKDTLRGTHCIADDLYLEKGNSLLSSMGTVGRDFFDLINELDCEEYSSFEDLHGKSLLSAIQSDILNLRDQGQFMDGDGEVSEVDQSIRIHSCHSPLREVEVLHDCLLAMFEDDANLMPKDVLVMTPDIELYAPYIEAVFDRPSHDPLYIPFSIADRTMRKESEIIDTFIRILDLAETRYSVTEVLAILDSRAVRRRFDFQEQDLDRIQGWLKEAGIRWGIDGESLHRLGLYPYGENTWKSGLERLLLGYAMPGHGENMFEGILACDNVEGAETDMLGRFVNFTDTLFTAVTGLTEARILDGWVQGLSEILEDFFDPDNDTEREAQFVRQMLADLRTIRELVDFHDDIDAATIRWYVKRSFDKQGFGFGFLTGGVTFCSMLPMRSIPSKIICLIGMNSTAYPRQSTPLGFDLIAQHPRRGDRSRRSDDRYLFLETFVSAREKLYISYIGQNIQDNTTIPPSVLVSELLDYIEDGFNLSKETLRSHLVTKHRLQGFNPEYFRGDKNLFSYSERNCGVAKCMGASRRDPVPFISRGLSEPGGELKTIDINDLCRFFSNPARFLLARRLGIYLEKESILFEEREKFEIKGLEKYSLAQELVKRKMAEGDLAEIFPLIRASGQIPHGTVGECLYEEISRGVDRFVERMKPFIADTPRETADIDITIEEFRVTGRLDNIYQDRLVRYRYARLQPRDYLTTWIQHLARNSGTPGGDSNSMLAGLRGGSGEAEWEAVEIRPVSNSREILRGLLRLYWGGLTKPLHFFPRVSWEFAEQVINKNRSRDDALRSAYSVWMGSDFSRGERDDPSYGICFHYTDPLDAEFQKIAEEVFRPVFDHLNPVRR